MNFIRDVTRKEDGSLRLSRDDIARLAALDISVSDTETTGLNRDRNGLTEIASLRAVREGDEDRLKLFHSFILPLKPAYQDYVKAVERAKAEGAAAPLYDRRLYEYDIEPAALAVTGTEIIRARKDGPITGLKVDGKRVVARPFYAVMDDFLAFARDGKNDVYYNAPFDKPFLATLIGDARAHALAIQNSHAQEAFQEDARIDTSARALFKEFAHRDYAALEPLQRAQMVEALKPFVQAPEHYSNSSLYQCLYYGYLQQCGFGPSNTLDDAVRKLVNPAHVKRGDHSGVEDVVLASQVALALAKEPRIPTMHGLFEKAFHTADGGAYLSLMPKRTHGKKTDGVEGDLAFTLSAPYAEEASEASRLRMFIEDFVEAPKRNSRLPEHIRGYDSDYQSGIINAERKQPLSLNFLKKTIFFSQLEQHPVFFTIRPYDSTGTRMDVVLQKRDAHGKHIVVEDINYSSLRANIGFLEAHSDDAETYLRLINYVRRMNRGIGTVLFKDREDGTVEITAKGHLRAFGHCVSRIPKGMPYAEAERYVEQQLAPQIKLGILPQVAFFGQREDAFDREEDDDEVAVDSHNNRHEDDASKSFLASQTDAEGKRLTLLLSHAAFQCVAHRLDSDVQTLLAAGQIITQSGTILCRAQEDGAVQLVGDVAAFNDFANLGDAQEVGEKPSNLIRDACWLLYRLERIPSTFGVTIEGDMATLNQKGGISVEALGLLYHVGIPFKAYGDRIKVDVHQLMKNAFHYSLALSRAQAQRKHERDMLSKAKPIADEDVTPQSDGRYRAPERFLIAVEQALLSGAAQAFEMNEKRDGWVLDAAKEGDQPAHHKVAKHARGIQLVHKAGKLVVSQSDVIGPHAVRYDVMDGGQLAVTSSSLLRRLALYNTTIDANAYDDGWSVLASDRALVQKNCDEASRFLYALCKQTGSERAPVKRATLEADGRVHFHFDDLAFLARDSLAQDVQHVRAAVAITDMDLTVRRLQSALPDPRFIDPRRKDLLELANTCAQQHASIKTLSDQLTGYLKLLGGSEHKDDPSAYNLSHELRDDLASLGMLLHEQASSMHGKAKQDDIWKAKQIAQEKLSAVAFGADQWREDLAVARKVLVGGTKKNGGLERQIGRALGAMWLEAAAEIITHPEVSFDTAIQIYEVRMDALLNDAEVKGYYARHAAMRLLMELADTPETTSRQQRVCRYFLQHGYSTYSGEQLDALIALYSNGNTVETRSTIEAVFPAKVSRQTKVTAEWILRQHHLLMHPKEAEKPITDAVMDAIRQEADAEISAAFLRRGRIYLDGAIIAKRASRVDAHDVMWDNAQACFMQAGWTQEACDKAYGRSLKREYSAERREYVREQLALTGYDMSDIRYLFKVIDLGDNALVAREHLVAKYVRATELQTARMVEDFLDPYSEHKHRRALLGDIEKTLKEISDVYKAKYHHARDLDGLLALLERDVTADKIIPEMAGIRDGTVSQVRDEVQDFNEAMRSHFMQHLHDMGVAFVRERDGTVTCDVHALEAAFEAWRTPKKQVAHRPMDIRLIPWLERASSRLFRCDAVQSVTMDKSMTAIECVVKLPVKAQERAEAWAGFRLAAHGIGLHVPAMPDGHDITHRLRIPLLREVVRGKRMFERPANAYNVREVVGAFAVQQGQPYEQERGFVNAVMQKSRRPHALDGALTRAEGYGADVNAIRVLLEKSSAQR